MITVILVIHLLVAIALVALVLLQRSEGGGLGMGGGGGGMSGFLTGRSAANLLTRTTAGLAVAFFVTSVVLAKLSGTQRAPASILDQPPGTSVPGASVPAPAVPGPGVPAAGTGTPSPAAPAEPTAPLGR